MKWNHNGIKYLRGCYEGLIAQYDGTGYWVTVRGWATQQTQKSNFKYLGEWLNASSIEVKHMYNEDDELQEPNIIIMMRKYDGSIAFYIELENGLITISNDQIKLYLPKH